MPIKITSYLTPELVCVPMASTSKNDAITELVDLMVKNNHVRERDRLLAAVLEREAQRTTGVGRGLAIPHAKTDVCPKLVVAFGRTAQPIDFASIDKQPVRLVVLLAGPPTETGLHIQILARLSRMVTNDAILRELLDAPGPAELYQVIKKNDDAAG